MAIAEWLRSNPAGEEIKPADNIPSLLDVEYNEKGRDIDSRWRIHRIVRIAGTGVLEIIIPSFNRVKDLSIAPGATNVSFAVSAASVALDKKAHGSADFEFSFDYTGQQIEERIIRQEFPTPEGSLLVTTASLKYRPPRYRKLVQVNPSLYGPASIISAMYL